MKKVKNILTRAAHLVPKDSTMLRYAVDGLFITAGVNMVANNNNLFASRLGADDYQLSLLQFLPQAVNLLILIPGGLFADSLRNKRRMVMGALFAAASLYLCMGFAPLVFAQPLYVYITLLSIATGAVMLHSISWQSFFTEVVDIRARNRVLTFRTLACAFIGMLVPLITGAVLSKIDTVSGKVAAHQSFFFAAASLLFLAAYNFRKFTAVNPAKPKRLTFTEIKKAGRSLVKNKAFLYFAATALFFYLTWQMDWTLYYIGQAQYLQMNEFLIMLTVVGGTTVQFATMRFWSRKNEKYGVVLPVTFGIIGLGICPIVMITATSMPPAIGPYVFLVLNSAANLCFATISLNMFQCLMQVLNDEYRSLSISIYTCMTCLTNAIMPVAGVALYKKLGGDLNALRNTFWIIFALRIIAAALWFIRWKKIKVKGS